MTDPLAEALMYENADLWVPGTPVAPVSPDLNSRLSIAGARLTDRLQGGVDALVSALMAPGNALQGNYDQRPIYADGSVGQFDPRMIEDAATLAGSISLGAAPIPRPANSIGAGGRAVQSFDDYVRLVNPSNIRISADDRPNLGMGDMYGMLPRGSRNVGSMDTDLGRINFMKGGDSYYATGWNPDVGEMDVFGYAMPRGDMVELAVVNEAQRRGIGAELQYLLRRDNPYLPTGGLTEAGENSLRKTYERLVREGVIFQ